ncbi:MAG: YrhB domain-containing protein [Armatimonadota bacterium]|nr:YrhB domain-containing protein [Armatimonadota bacterium]MDR7422517.1 YrhB domain-containing protein [Armatimonadota bacterium]MDR7455367.1 YrhB domain-containing protein [Armatimonadota bacterium]MDR7457159.1 YrhB domain-containing protein [Armatimonadota bacterium]MDR7496549.1 YrhB domain-containing protein [Armatimonadota bacterium]
MVDREQATAIARSFVARIPAPEDDELVLRDDATVERAFGWVFVYTSKKHLDTGDDRYALFGNAPVIVDRQDGSVHETGTARPLAYYIQEYEYKKGLRPDPPDPALSWAQSAVAEAARPERTDDD